MDDTNNSGNLVCLPEKKKIRLSGEVAFFFFKQSPPTLRPLRGGKDIQTRHSFCPVTCRVGKKKKSSILL